MGGVGVKGGMWFCVECGSDGVLPNIFHQIIPDPPFYTIRKSYIYPPILSFNISHSNITTPADAASPLSPSL